LLAKVLTALPHGLQGRLVEVQVDVAAGGPAFMMVGFASGSVREAKERVRAAIRNSDRTFPLRKLTVNLAPTGLRKKGTKLDLTIAIGISLADLRSPSPERTAFLGELGLDGRVRHVNGVLVLARSLAAQGVRELFVPEVDAAEAALAAGLAVVPCPSLGAVLAHLSGAARLPRFAGGPPAPPPEEWDSDHAEDCGQELARRSLQRAASGGTNLLVMGAP